MRVFIASLLLLTSVISAAEKVNFLAKPLSAGKALLTENGYMLQRLPATANFSPELRFPVQLVYDSSREKTGIFGYGWYSPQLESSAFYDKDGVLWTTPWGEKIKFFSKSEETPKDAVKIELYELAKKGKGFYAPYADWEATTTTNDKKLAQSGTWTITGKRRYVGWKMIYRNGRLQSITAPSGRYLTFSYTRGKLQSISQNDLAFIEVTYSGDQVTELVVNGIAHRFTYRANPVVVLPKVDKGQPQHASRPMLSELRKGELQPECFDYDSSGFLIRIRHGSFTDDLKIQHQNLQQRQAELKARKDRKIKYSGPINGRLIEDFQYRYEYPDFRPGKVKLINKLKQTASFDFNQETGVFQLQDFSGKSHTVYYFMRYDVAYLGKVRKIMDGRGREVASFRYDKLSGNLLRFRDMFGNDRNFIYNQTGLLRLVTRRAAEQQEPEPVMAYKYDLEKNPCAMMMLDASGKTVSMIEIRYNVARQPQEISDGRRKDTIRYNRFGYPISITDIFGQTREIQYDKFNRTTGMKDVFGVTTRYTLNSSGLITQIERLDGETVLNSLSVEYNGTGLPLSYTAQDGKVKKFERDAFGRVVKELFPDNTEVAYTYDALGRLNTVLDQNRHTIRFDWSKFGLDARRTPAGQLTDYVHDQYGLLRDVVSKEDRRVDKRVRYQYDQYDRLIRVDYGNGQTMEYSYDAWGRIASVRRGKETELRRYDYWGRLISRQNGERQTLYAYNNFGQRISMDVRNGAFVHHETRTYDEFGRLTSIKSEKDTVFFCYNARNQLERQVVNGTPILFYYDKYGRLLKKEMSPMLQPVSSSSAEKGEKK